MKHRKRIYYSDSQKALMWERWGQGATLHQIAAMFDRAHTSVQQILARHGGIRPPERRRAAIALTLAEREGISRALAEPQSIRSIAARLGRAPSTVSREIKRNGGAEDYRAAQADEAAWDRALRPKRCALAANRSLAKLVTDKLRQSWSPQQIAGWLKHTYPSDPSRQVSHETIYRSLFIQARGALNRELLQHLRRTRGMRRSRHYTQKTENHGRIVDAVYPSASDLPPSKIEPSRAIGKAICCSAATTARSPPWWSVRLVTSCWPGWAARTPRRSSARSSSMLASCLTSCTSH